MSNYSNKANFNPIVEGVLTYLESLEDLQRKIKRLELIIKIYEDPDNYCDYGHEHYYCNGKDCKNILVISGDKEHTIGNFMKDPIKFYYRKCNFCLEFYKPLFCNKCISEEDLNWYKVTIFAHHCCDKCYDKHYDELGYLRDERFRRF